MKYDVIIPSRHTRMDPSVRFSRGKRFATLKMPGAILGAMAWVGSLLMPDVIHGQDFRIVNLSSVGVGSNSVYFDSSSISYSQPPSSPANLEIFCRDDASQEWSHFALNTNIAKTYKTILRYNGSVPDGTVNSNRFSGCASYPGKLLFTYLLEERSGKSAGDCRKVIVDAGGTEGAIALVPISNAVANQDYATNSLHVAPIETTITHLAGHSDGVRMTITARVRPGTVVWPQYCTNLHDGFMMGGEGDLTNSAKYLPVDSTNFGGYGSLVWTNVPMGTNGHPRYFRLACDSYTTSFGNPLAPINIAAVPGVIAPVIGATPVTNITATSQYTGTVSWSPAHKPFQSATAYSATVTLVPKAGFTLAGVGENFFTVTGATASNAAHSGIVTAVFPATDTQVNQLNFAWVFGVPAAGIPSSSYPYLATSQYRVTQIWWFDQFGLPFSGNFVGGEFYQAIVAISAQPGYTLTGVSENAFYHDELTGISHSANPASVDVFFYVPIF